MALSLIPRRRIWTEQPQESVPLAPEYADAAFLYDAARDADISNIGAVYTATGTSIAVDTAGLVRQVDTAGGSGNSLSWPTNAAYDPPSTGYTMFFYGRRLAGSSAQYDRIFGRDFNVNSPDRFGFLLTPNSDGTAPNRVYFNNENGTTGTNVGYTSANLVAPTDRYVLYMLSHDGTTARLYADGVLQDSQTCTPPASSSRTLRIGRSTTGGASDGAPFDIALAGLLRRAVSAAEAVAIGANPWQLFAPRRMLFPFLAANADNLLGQACL